MIFDPNFSHFMFLTLLYIVTYLFFNFKKIIIYLSKIRFCEYEKKNAKLLYNYLYTNVPPLLYVNLYYIPQF